MITNKNERTRIRAINTAGQVPCFMSDACFIYYGYKFSFYSPAGLDRTEYCEQVAYVNSFKRHIKNNARPRACADSE